MLENLLYQSAAVMAVLGALLIGPLITLPLLVRRKRRDRAARKSPLTEDLLRGPGHTIREQVEELRLDFAMDLVLLMVIPTSLLAFYLATLQVKGLANPRFIAWVFVLMAVGLLVHMARKLHLTSLKLDTLRKGLDAEMAVGQELDQLMRQGAAVFHDFPAEQFNIDHVVIAAQGVFAVETKGYTKRIVALPGWYVNRKGRGAVRVFSGKELPALLKAGTANALSAERMQQVVHQVEQRCRTVKPWYRPDDD